MKGEDNLEEQRLSLARKIFLNYGGNHYYMEREGEYDYYKSFNISKEQEHLWIKEYQLELLEKIEVEKDIGSLFASLGGTIRHYNDMNCLNLMLEVAERKAKEVDSFTALRIAEEILNAVEPYRNSKLDETNIIQRANNIALEILKNILKSPITVALYYREFDYLKDVITDESIIQRVKYLVQNWSSK